MPSNTKIANTAREAMCNALVALLDAGAGAASTFVRTGAPPTNVADADSGTLLGTLVHSDPAFGASNSTGTSTANSITPATAAASGDAGHFRSKDSNGNTIIQGTAGEAADTPDMTFNEKSIVAGGQITCSSYTITVPVQ